MSLVKASILSVTSTIINVICKIIINKVLAIYVGPTGYSIIGQFQSLISTLTAIGTAGISNGVTKLTAEFSENSENLKRIWSTAFILSVFVSIITSIVIIIFSNNISKELFGNEIYTKVIIILALVLPFISIYILITSIITGLQLYRVSTTLSIFYSLVSMITISLGAIFFGVVGIIYSTIITYIIASIISIIYFKRKTFKKLRISKLTLDINYTKPLFIFTVMSVFTSIIGPLANIYIRQDLISQYGLHNTGLWDAMNRISAMLILFVTAPLNMYLMPKLSGIKTSVEINKEVIGIYKLGIPILIIVSIIIYLLREIIIRTLFTNDFYYMKVLFEAQLIGDFFKSISIVISYYFLSRSLIKEFVSMEVVAQVILVTLTSYLINSSESIISASIAYAYTNIICTIFYILIYIKSVRNI